MVIMCFTGTYSLSVLWYADFQQGKVVAIFIFILMIAGFGLIAFKCLKYIYHSIYVDTINFPATDVPTHSMSENTPKQEEVPISHLKKQTKNCKFCQTEIPKKARVCPNCKRALSTGHGCLISILIFVIIISSTVAISISVSDNIQKSVSGVSDETHYITMDEFNQIETGMSYKKVKKIIGSDGKLISTSSVGDITISIYTWNGNGMLGSNANVTFTNNEVTAKAQIGLN